VARRSLKGQNKRVLNGTLITCPKFIDCCGKVSLIALAQNGNHVLRRPLSDPADKEAAEPALLMPTAA
jgi:hypothetical protein